MTSRIVLVARNAFRSIMSRRALYIWAAAILLMVFRATPQIGMALRGPEQLRLFNLAGAVVGSLEVWALLSLAAAIFLGGGSVATEIASRTIVSVLARPLRRWELLVGKWLGVSAFALATLGIGVALALGLAWYLGVEIDLAVLRLAVELTAVAIVVYSGIAVVLGVYGSWVIASGLTVLLAFAPILIQELKSGDEPSNWRRLGVALDWLVPDGYRSQYALANQVRRPSPPQRPGRPQSVAPGRVEVESDDHYEHVLENLSYGTLYFLAGCAVFSRRSINLA